MAKSIVLVLLAAVMIFSLGVQRGECEDDDAEGNVAKILRKLDQILTNQQEMEEQMEKIKEELEIVKVRATKR